jgi:DNA polymerase III delta prime subunit
VKRGLVRLANNMFDNLFVEKYRPKRLCDIILSPTNERAFKEFAVKQEIPNLVFLGNPGIGKTSLAKILVNDVLGCQYLYINASDENGIDTIRNKVINFAQTKSIDGKIKVIILDEADALSVDAQRALRNTMEEFSGVTRFILTGNFKYKIIPALLSRCQSFDLTPPLDKVVVHCFTVLRKEGIKISDQCKNKFVEFVKNIYPDIRRCINELQKYSIGGELILPENTTDELCETLYSFISKKDVVSLRKYLITNESLFNSDYINLLKSLFNYIDQTELDVEKRKMGLLTIAEHLYRSAFVADQEINCYAACISLTTLR